MESKENLKIHCCLNLSGRLRSSQSRTLILHYNSGYMGGWVTEVRVISDYFPLLELCVKKHPLDERFPVEIFEWVGSTNKFAVGSKAFLGDIRQYIQAHVSESLRHDALKYLFPVDVTFEIVEVLKPDSNGQFDVRKVKNFGLKPEFVNVT